MRRSVFKVCRFSSGVEIRQPPHCRPHVIERQRQHPLLCFIVRRRIAQHVWSNEADTFASNTIDVHLARLRSKLAGAGVRIETVRGVGYRMTPA